MIVQDSDEADQRQQVQPALLCMEMFQQQWQLLSEHSRHTADRQTWLSLCLMGSMTQMMQMAAGRTCLQCFMGTCP